MFLSGGPLCKGVQISLCPLHPWYLHSYLLLGWSKITIHVIILVLNHKDLPELTMAWFLQMLKCARIGCHNDVARAWNIAALLITNEWNFTARKHATFAVCLKPFHFTISRRDTIRTIQTFLITFPCGRKLSQRRSLRGNSWMRSSFFKI